MEQLVLLDGNLNIQESERICEISLENEKLKFAMIKASMPDVDFKDDKLRDLVLVEKIAFSCNYRDKAILLKQNNAFKKKTASVRAIGFGSEFVAKVIAVGKNVKDLKVGDYVINNAAYPYSPSGAPIGLPTNYASLRFDVFHFGNLFKIPLEFSLEKAAGFTIGAITSFSMIEKLNLRPEDKILITSAKSNTSLFVLNALKHKFEHIYVSSTSEKYKEWFDANGVKKFIFPEDMDLKSETMKVAKEIDGFTAVIDPFFDINLELAVNILSYGGKYVTCGLYDQFYPFVDSKPKFSINATNILTSVMMKNLLIIGNCLGQQKHLEEGVKQHLNLEFEVPIDSIFKADNIKDFLNKSFGMSDRLGKVIFMYSKN
jgi:NADPH:quinone reductase-like Zn-dependent oxidoreductase